MAAQMAASSRFTRGFELRLKNEGDLIAQGVQQVVTLDSKTMRPAPPPESIMANFQIENPTPYFPGATTELSTDGILLIKSKEMSNGEILIRSNM